MINNLIRFGCNACSMNPYGCNVCSYFSTFGTSKARWCCGGDPSSEIQHYAFLCRLSNPPTQLLDAPGAIAFTPAALTKGFSYNANNQLVLLQAGVYKAVYTLNIPAGAVVDTTLQLQLNGATIPCSQISVSHTAADGTVTITGQALFESSYASTLQLVSSAALQYAGDNAGDVLATLMVSRL